ncbi:putative serine carboxypeptidase CPVL [Pseudolycoriella hygida]|uniref:Serine carboxypeptidase CPVL n=1 Tax=Pseudolycoriella hygida TaxID=35572 RepID=A0A9Q0MN94_9DIPT|nr:putative serine carboxypeptidase CPVL [Pseudolycoriella hygida]
MFGLSFITVFVLLFTRSALSQTDPLFLTPLIKSGNITEARSLSLVLELPNSSVDIPSRPSYSGFITVNETYNSNLFFWFFPATSNDTQAEKTPIVLWLDGGPGVSNFLTIFTQNGPFSVAMSLNGTFGLKHRPEDWTVNTSIIYLENPVDVGFSFTSDPAGLPKTSEEAAVDSIEFLRQFFLLFPEYDSNPFFLVGQSYGGHFAPAVGTAIHQRNKENQQPTLNFQGMLLIAPWTNPLVQVDSYAEFFYHTALIDERTRQEIATQQKLIQGLINEEKFDEAKDVWTDMLLNPSSIFNSGSGFTTALTLLEDQLDATSFYFVNYVELPEFRQALHVGNLTYTLVSEAIQQSMSEEFMASKSEHVEELLRAEKYKIIVATGQLDLTVTHTGMEKMLNGFVWSGQNEWKTTNRTVWRSANGHVAGYKKEALHLTMYLIRNAGHLLIGDQMEWSLELVNEIFAV